jgi:hypothetical protein
MSNNLFYKALAAVSTVGIVVIAASSFLSTANKQGDGVNKLLEKTNREVVQARKEAIREIRSAKKEALRSIRSIGGSKKGKVWLVLKWAGWSYHNAGDLEKIEMESMDQCELMGAKWIASKRTHQKMGERFEDMTFTCLDGK